ncbi:MAG: HAD-superfamily hydrolase, subfamily variant 1 [Acidimicrobiales bacterium]|jgi:pyrophosphatase PpaX|nr:HAD-superfamily hydrolase, subfamily variant 1 [Acidimicrobiales bacterium]
MARLAAVIFDLDGTLADSLPLSIAGFQHAASHVAGRSFTDDEVRAGFGPSEEGMFRRMVPDRWDECLAAYLEFYDEHHDERVRVLPGVADLLSSLHDRGVRVGVVTGKGPETAAITLRKLGLADTITEVRAGRVAGPDKPTDIRSVLGAWALHPPDAAYVGDMPGDMRAALDVGVVPLGAAWEIAADEADLRTAGAVEVFATPGELSAWLR